MRRNPKLLALATLAMLALAPALAQPASETAAPAVNPAAMKALSDMGAYLRGLEAFQVTVATSDEDVLDDGQKLQYDGESMLLVRMPDRFRAEVTDERKDRIFFYDGKNLTLYGKRLNYYATVPAPPTIRELAAKLESEYGMSIPLADLFHWGAVGYEPLGITSALDAGPSAVNGVTCRHWIFRQPGLDWQVWIQSGAYPLPLKLVITTTSDEARPQHTSVFDWNLAPSYSDSAFTFEAPEGAGRVQLGRETQEN